MTLDYVANRDDVESAVNETAEKMRRAKESTLDADLAGPWFDWSKRPKKPEGNYRLPGADLPDVNPQVYDSFADDYTTDNWFGPKTESKPKYKEKAA